MGSRVGQGVVLWQLSKGEIVLPNEAAGEKPDHRPYRPPLGIPDPARPGREATLASLLLHILLIFLVLAPPIWVSKQIDAIQQQGPRGDGRVGGGGGGNRGTGGPESVRYMAFPTAQPEDMKAVPTPPVPVPIPPEEKPPEPPKPEPTPDPPVEEPPTVKPAAPEVASVEPGTGGGTGKDGTAGSGPGTGGGTGSGVGTGAGTGVGPGTGAGNGDDDIFPPNVIALPILPVPVPNKVRPYNLVAYFEVDTLGAAKLLSYNPPPDGGYNRRVREMLLEIRFRPAVRKDGRAVLDTAIVTFSAPRS
jgi:hypothetical protein